MRLITSYVQEVGTLAREWEDDVYHEFEHFQRLPLTARRRDGAKGAGQAPNFRSALPGLGGSD